VVGHVVPVELRNSGAQAAEAVTVEAALETVQGGRSAETVNITVAYLPGRGRRTARLQFRRDPREAKLVVRSVSYAVP